jgi:A/G-specific adenine glycosylase
MPWRETSDPYRILVSELMLHQTQADRVIPKYQDFLDAFPDVRRLAAAGLGEVLAKWQGLGYNRRARYLHEAARHIVAEHDGQVPGSEELLRQLPGVGPYTAGAVAAFAFGQPVVFIETNIRRVYLHVFRPGREKVTDAELLPFVAVTMDSRRPRDWYYALMDYGASLAGQFTNSNRRSAHYRRQSRFHGSTREVRGRIIRTLTRVGRLERMELERQVALGDERFGPAVEGLVRDGLIRENGGFVELA